MCTHIYTLLSARQTKTTSPPHCDLPIERTATEIQSETHFQPQAKAAGSRESLVMLIMYTVKDKEYNMLNTQVTSSLFGSSCNALLRGISLSVSACLPPATPHTPPASRRLQTYKFVYLPACLPPTSISVSLSEPKLQSLKNIIFEFELSLSLSLSLRFPPPSLPSVKSRLECLDPSPGTNVRSVPHGPGSSPGCLWQARPSVS